MLLDERQTLSIRTLVWFRIPTIIQARLFDLTHAVLESLVGSLSRFRIGG